MSSERVAHGDTNSPSIATGVVAPAGGRARRFGMAAILVVAAGGFTSLAASGGAGASDGDHVLNVAGASVNSYKHSGSAIHWETRVIGRSESVTYEERQQTWTGNGSEHLEDCEGGLHWISNENVLTISHCLDDDETTTTSTEPEQETTTTSTEPGQETTTTSTEPGQETTTTAAGVVPTSTEKVASNPPAAPVQAPTTQATAVDPATVELPSTGSSSWAMALMALAALLGGTGLVRLSRRPTD
jgi:LPXTG-motif cell wall-anchored protein